MIKKHNDKNTIIQRRNVVKAYANIQKGEFYMAKTYFTLTGTKHYYGTDFLEKGMKITLEKEPDNEYDKEAIQVKMKGMGKIGYVANSPYTIIGDSMSAGRIYDRIDDKAKAKIVMVTPMGVLCKLCKKKKNKKILKGLESKENEITVKHDMVTEERILEALKEIEE